MIVGCLQYRSLQNESDTLKKILPLIEESARLNVDLIALPECATFLRENKSETLKVASIEGKSQSLKELKKAAKTFKINILIGSLQTLEKKKFRYNLYNRSFLINTNGKIITKYDKIHMYNVNLSTNEVFRESKTYNAGSVAKIGCLKNKNINYKIGLTICYDLRFPNLFRKLAIFGADIITVPSFFMHTTGKVHWHTLLKARAIETGCYIIAPAQIGSFFNQRKDYGHSLIISPWGKILKDAKRKEGIIIEKISLEQVKEARLKIPSLKMNKKIQVELNS